MLVGEYAIKFILLYDNGTRWAHGVALPAIDTPIAMQHGLALSHTQCLRGADPHTVRTANAHIGRDFKCVPKTSPICRRSSHYP